MRSTLGGYLTKIVVMLALALSAVAVPAGGAAAATGSPKITLTQMKPAPTGSSYSISGRLVNTGARNNKTIVVQRRTGAQWRTLAVKKRQDDGRYHFRRTSAAAGVMKIRAIVRLGKRTLAVSPTRTLSVLNAPSGQVRTETAQRGESGPSSNFTITAGSQTMRDFLSYVLGDVQRYWAGVWAQYGLPTPSFNYYWPVPGEAFYHACTPTGTYVDDFAAHYCPENDYIVITTGMAAQLWQASGDFAVAMVVAHEYAHNLQRELRLERAGLPTRSYELHADCWAGVWANSAYYQGILEAGDIKEAVLAAGLAGDAGGPQDHGTSAQRQTAFLTGYNSGQPTDCNVYLQ